ncbi:PadR family transcriptional regulator [Amycolatopsis thermophila]|uniref:DNA-binding PadR family transcriptional regulator n=1 Tax=Amycolatopsis thermophila TaxID=206084 RepID=A0ABU0ET13_9PSEU|nr:PadR family transcriptional regulator [Amycolatopsis thermophila]MDQ0378279.1 DNA-binding PadR family transcriptional regulator [Amycolatopsis thermophila]
MLEFAILGLLHEAPMHGYVLRKRLHDTLGMFRTFSYGSLYPTLRRLQRAGFIEEADSDVGQGDEPVKGWGRRARTVYKLTAEGKEHFAKLLADAGPQTWEDEGFGVHLAFFSRTPADVRMRILEGRRRRVEERREGLRAALARAEEKIDRYTRELHRLGLESSEREVRWLNELIAHEQDEQERGLQR